MNVKAQGFTFKPYELSVEVFKTDGRPFVNAPTDIEGTPFFDEAWKPAIVVLQNAKTVGNVKMRLNLQTQEAHFLDKNNAEMAVPAGLIKEIRFTMTPGPDSLMLTFREGFPPVDGQDHNNFYLILLEGKIALVCALSKSVVTKKDPISGEVKKEFVNYENYYLFRNGSMVRVRKDKGFIISKLSDRRDQISEFVDKNRLNYRSIEDIKKIIGYYNSFP
jgi:hypothetical protein